MAELPMQGQAFAQPRAAPLERSAVKRSERVFRVIKLADQDHRRCVATRAAQAKCAAA
jgi:hypothetical protein